MRLSDKVAVVTGAASGFGEGIARLYAAEGAAVVLADVAGQKAQSIAQEIEAEGGRARAISADVADRAETKAMIAAAVDDFGGLDILVQNAGVTHLNKPFDTVEETEYDRIFDVNVKALYFGTQEALPALRERGGGVIINTSSTAALRPRPGLAVYNASKGAVNILTKSLAVELAGENIRVNAICPVIGETGLTETFMGKADTPENRAAFEATIPIGRFSTPQDIAQAALYLAAEESSFLTGVCLEVDGGRCI